ncbi:hypothetical protein ACIF6L_26680 [Kitasatospora sp. NPDC086009]|uniref:hypothetical protein n=1 Tax=unclassified Kitasatospora TaxID=2633591 RepID=UPI0037C73ED1
MEIVEADHEGEGLVPTLVRVNGVDVGRLAEPPTVRAGGDDEPTTVTLTLLPSEVVIKGEPKGARPQLRKQPFGFKAPKP